MVSWDVIQRLSCSFPRSFINQHGEFIAHDKANEYFILKNCETELDIKCKVLEWLSRGACKSNPYRSNKSNEEFHEFMLAGINKFLQTNFTYKDMQRIYIHIGNACNHQKTIRFVESGYDFSILMEGE